MNSSVWYKLKPYLLILVLAFFVNAAGADIFAQKVKLRGKITPECAASGNSDWKFADLFAEGNIAVQGSFTCRGAFIYDLSDPANPVLKSHYNPNNNIQFLEAVIVGKTGYFGSGNGFGVHIVDLSDPANPKLLGVVDASHGNGFDRIHEIVVWGDYLIENYNGFSNKLIKVINVSNPANPVFIRDINPTEVNWVHAMHIRGNRMFTSGWGNSANRGRTEIYDVSNIAAEPPVLLGFIEDTSSTTAGNNMHSSWTSEDGNYLYSCREVTGSNGNNPGDLRVYDIRNPAQPLLVNKISMADLGLNAVTPHNPVVKGNRLYVSWYQAGVQIFDISTPDRPKRIGQYDTYQPAYAPPAELDKNGDASALSALTSDVSWDVICGSANLQNNLPTSYDGNWAVFPFLGEDKILAGDMKEGLLILDASKAADNAKNQISDFDGDGRSDFSVFNKNTGKWSVIKSSDNQNITQNFGLGSDTIVTGDYDGDGKSDFAVWRPTNGVWYVLGSTKGFYAEQFGANGDVPVAADYDADGKTDFAVWRPTNGAWYIRQSSLGTRIVQWGSSGDKVFAGDYEGDGKADLAVYRPSTGIWYVLKSSSSQPLIIQFGLETDKPLSADFDGDAKSDFAVYRPSEGNWYILNSAANSLSVIRFGLSEDLPIPADFDGDGKSDIAVFRPSSSIWYRLNSSDSSFDLKSFGETGDVPSPSSVQPK